MRKQTLQTALALLAILSTACAAGGPTDADLEALRPLGIDEIVTTDQGWLLLDDRGDVRGRVTTDDDGATSAELDGYTTYIEERTAACTEPSGADAPLQACLPAMQAVSVLTNGPAPVAEVAGRREALVDDLDGCLTVEGCVDWEAPDICWHWLVCKVNCGLAPGYSCHYEM